MPIENATVISELNPDWPVGASDFVSQGDDQLRMLKKVLQNTFPNASAPITATPEQIDNVAIGIQYHVMDDGTGFYDVYTPDRSEDAAFSVRTCTLDEYKKSTHLAINYDFVSLFIYPVGCQYTSYTDGRNPYDILGFGTWEPIVGLIAGVGSAADNNSYTQNYSLGYQPGWWRVGNAQIVGQQLPVQLTMDPVDPHSHGEGEINSFYNDSGHTATVPGDGPGLTGSAGGHTPTGTGEVTIGSGGFTDGTPFYNPYYGAYIWKRTA
ncbi:hypothetical protein IU871_000726 [Salmonella enterica subsp. enterica serovar Havana]|uniref:Baseplate structural protein Gp10 C-terminal domain-containing protein n=2 Tax=Salmonella enterica I TaxID=59201 RepID=A0A610ILC5_SALET|nr:hypothetical protein [Salmonella enterica]EBU2944160.1 hypothetical protein [Salmonella enterica subsp. enterica]EAA7662571.1 hypothetical protein [Salmonella enterica subsp. enterica serovar Havana]EBA1299538.1 hypothetical protein [Salmonella enterica]EBG9920950.1 hypothetical protein [Salmonella enterica]EBH8291311.1 hypothetical protein [Salmonella enterica subsp. enterica serovar Havana]